MNVDLIDLFYTLIATLFGLSAAVHGILIPPVMLLHKLLAAGWDGMWDKKRKS